MFNEIEKRIDDEMEREREFKMDKLTIGFIADILYIKGILYYDEFDDIMNAKQPSDLQDIVEKMLRGEYSAYRQGEGYVLSGTK